MSISLSFRSFLLIFLVNCTLDISQTLVNKSLEEDMNPNDEMSTSTSYDSMAQPGSEKISYGKLEPIQNHETTENTHCTMRFQTKMTVLFVLLSLVVKGSDISFCFYSIDLYNWAMA